MALGRGGFGMSAKRRGKHGIRATATAPRDSVVSTPPSLSPRLFYLRLLNLTGGGEITSRTAAAATLRENAARYCVKLPEGTLTDRLN